MPQQLASYHSSPSEENWLHHPSIGSNYTVSKTSREIKDYLNNLDSTILKKRNKLQSPYKNLHFEYTRVHYGIEASKYFFQLEVILDNSKISESHLQWKGVHLNARCKGRLVLNYFSKWRNFRKFPKILNDVPFLHSV